MKKTQITTTSTAAGSTTATTKRGVFANDSFYHPMPRVTYFKLTSDQLFMLQLHGRGKCEFIGAVAILGKTVQPPTRNRASDIRLRVPALYQLNYRGHLIHSSPFPPGFTKHLGNMCYRLLKFRRTSSPVLRPGWPQGWFIPDEPPIIAVLGNKCSLYRDSNHRPPAYPANALPAEPPGAPVTRTDTLLTTTTSRGPTKTTKHVGQYIKGNNKKK